MSDKMKYSFQDINSGFLNYCQISGEKNMIEVIDLGDQPLSDTLLNKDDLRKPEKFYPLKILRSPKLGHSQLNYVVPHNELYHLDYPYRPGITREIVEHHTEQSKANKKKYSLKDGDLVIDVGSNDGTLLKCYKNVGLNVLGVEPTNMAQVANKDGIETIQSPLTFEVSKQILKKKGKAKLITATNVFAHMGSLATVMESVINLLSDDGFFIIENHNMKDILKHNQYDTFYHEHIRNYSFISLKYLFEMYDLKVVDANVVERYNGSIRVAVTKNKNQKEFCDIKKIIKDELEFGILEESTWSNFANKISRSKDQLLNTLIDLKKEGKSIAGNSCPARCSTLINYCDIGTDLIPYIAEQPTSFKLNKFLPGKKIPIIDNKILFKEQPDYVLILAWHLSKPIIEQLKEKGLKSKFIIPLPDVQIID